MIDATRAFVASPDKYISVDDVLEVAMSASVIGPFILQARILLPEGRILVYREPFQHPGDRTLQFFQFKMPEGFILSADVGYSLLIASPLRGQVWAKMFITRLLGGTNAARLGLAQGYITLTGSLSWPNNDSDFGQQGVGATIEQTVANPGPGVDWSITVPANAVWVVQSVIATLATAVAAANRFPHLQFFDGANAAYDSTPIAAQTASLTVKYVWGAGDTSQAVIDGVTNRTFPPGLRLNANFSIRTATTAIQGADQWSTIRLILQEFNAPGG